MVGRGFSLSTIFQYLSNGLMVKHLLLYPEGLTQERTEGLPTSLHRDKRSEINYYMVLGYMLVL